MEEHANFAEQLLDPNERMLKSLAAKTADSFGVLRRNPVPLKAPNMVAAKAIEKYKASVEKGLVTGEVQSAIDPRLMDHVRREAVRFQDEFKRA